MYRQAVRMLSLILSCVCLFTACTFVRPPEHLYESSGDGVLSATGQDVSHPALSGSEYSESTTDTESWEYMPPQSEDFWEENPSYEVPSVSSQDSVPYFSGSSYGQATASSGSTGQVFSGSNKKPTMPAASVKPSVPAVTSKPAASQSPASPAKPNTATQPAMPAPTPPKVYTGTITVRTPAASGTVVYQGAGAAVDASHMSEGYIMVKCTSSAPRIKMQVKFGDYTYNYDLNKDGKYETFPLQGGSTAYTVRILENVTGTKYREIYSVKLDAQISDGNLPFLYPSQYVNFTASSKAVKKSYDLCVGASTDLQKIEAIYSYITANVSYDSGKASSALAGQLSGYLPDIDATLASGKGICFDYAALMAAMLRAQNIPAKLAIGTVAPNGVSHAWNLVYTKEKGWIAFQIEFKGNTWKLMDSTFGAAKGQSIEQYIGNGSSYTQLRVY